MQTIFMEAAQPTSHDMRDRLAELRDEFGDQDWLTVVSGVVGAGYRLAGLSGPGLGALLREQVAQRDQLSLHLRRKPLMALRRGFDGGSGVISLDGGVAELALFVEGQGWRYTEREGDRPRAFVSRKLPSHLLITGGLNRSLHRVLGTGVPRCITHAAPRVTSIGIERHAWGEMAALELSGGFETLAPMPDDVARRLGREPQRHLGHIPALGIDGPEPATALVRVAATAAPKLAGRTRPALRLVKG